MTAYAETTIRTRVDTALGSFVVAVDRRQVLGSNQADWWPTEVIESDTLNGPCRFGGEALAPEPIVFGKLS